MAMLMIECPNCGHTDALRGWVEPEDLKDTPWAELDEQGIAELEKRQKAFWTNTTLGHALTPIPFALNVGLKISFPIKNTVNLCFCYQTMV